MTKLGLFVFTLIYAVSAISLILFIIIFSALTSGMASCINLHNVDTCYVTFTPEKP